MIIITVQLLAKKYKMFPENASSTVCNPGDDGFSDQNTISNFGPTDRRSRYIWRRRQHNKGIH